MLKELFDSSLDLLLRDDAFLFYVGLHEQTLVARLAYHLQAIIKVQSSLANYFVDVEYNRAHAGVPKVLRSGNRVFVDLALHGRGLRGKRENILCAEMKKRHGAKPWRDPAAAAALIFPRDDRQCGAKNECKAIEDDQKKLLEFTGQGDAHNLSGNVQAYELGVLLVPRCTTLRRNNEMASIEHVFIRYYNAGTFSDDQDRLVNVDWSDLEMQRYIRAAQQNQY